MAHDPLTLGHRIRHHRGRAGLTLGQLGDRIGRPASFLSLVENGKRDITVAEIDAVADALGVPFSDLLRPEPPTRRSALEISLTRIQDHPRYAELGLPHLKITAGLPDLAMEHIVALFEALDDDAGANPATEVRTANGLLARELAANDGYLAAIEDAADETLVAGGYTGNGPVTGREIGAILERHGLHLHPVDDVPPSVRSIVDPRLGRVYVAQRNELRTRQARKAVLQTVATEILGHREPTTIGERLRQRLETAYFAGAVLVPERAAVPFLRASRDERDLSVEDLKEQFYVSYEMAAQRFTNLATRHLDIPTHFLRTDEDGVIWKAYANDGIPLPTDAEGGHEGGRICRMWGGRAALRSPDRFDLHHQFTDTPAGSYWSATHVSPEPGGHAFTVGVRFGDAGVFRGRGTKHHLRSGCPDGTCCREGEPGVTARVHHRMQDRIVGLLEPELGPRLDPAELAEFLAGHVDEEGLSDESFQV